MLEDGANPATVPQKSALTEAEIDDVENVEGEEKEEEEQVIQIDEYLLLKLAKNGEWSTMFRYLPLIQRGNPALRTQDKSSGWTPLFYIVADNQLEIFYHFMECGADLLHKANDGRMVTHVAAQFATYDMNTAVFNHFSADQVMSTTADLDLNPMHYACVRLNQGLDIVKLYLRAGKEHRLTEDANGAIPLMLAAEVENLPLCRELLLVYAVDQVTASNKYSGDTVLHIACRTRQLELVRLFCEQGAQIDAQNVEGHTALHVAAWEGYEEIIRYFQQRNASAHIFDKMDRSALHIAAERGHTAVVEILIDRFKASVAARTKDGSTLLHISSQCGHPDTALMFLKKGVPLLMPNKAGATCLHVAATQGHVAVVKSLCQSGAQVDFTNKEGQTPLHLAVECCKPMVVQTLLGFGADVQLASGIANQTPLHLAAKVLLHGERVAEMLIKSGADVNAVDIQGETPVHIAARCGNTKVLAVLLQEDADPTIRSQIGETCIHIAVRYCHYEVVERLLRYTATEMTMQDAIQLVNTGNQEGETSLHLAAELTPDCAHYNREEVKVIKLLLEYKADLYLETSMTKETPIHCCARGGNSAILSAILAHLNEISMQEYEKGGEANKTVQSTQLRSLNIRNKAGWSPLMVASDSGHAEVVEILLNNNVRVDLFDEGGNTALHFASDKGYMDIADELLWHKAFVNARTKLGVTPLHLAAQSGHSRLCQLLINSHTAVVDVLTLTRKTPLHLAAQEGQIDVCQALLDLGADAFANDMEEQTPLHLAAEKDFSEVVKLFLSSQPDLVNICNSEGRTCAHIAASKGSLSVIKGLVKFNREGLVFDRDSISGSTTLHLSAAGGFHEIVSLLLDNGANALDENDEGLTPLHMAAIHGHTQVLEVLKAAQIPLNYCSKVTGFTAIHMAAHYGQTEFVQELLQDVGAQIASSPPAGMDTTAMAEIGVENFTEYGFTPLHLAAQNGHENLVRLLLNSPGVQPEVHTQLHGTTPLHLAAQAGHSNVIGLLLSKNERLLLLVDKLHRSSLHMAAANGHRDLCVLLVGQGADINKKDVNDWTPLHFASKAGHLETVEALVETGANALLETKDRKQPICYAAANSHFEVLIFLLKKPHNCHKLIEDPRYIFDMIQCSDSADDPYKVVRYFILWSPAPLEISLKLAASYVEQSVRRKDRAKEFFMASRFCQKMGVDLTSVTTSVAATEDVGKAQDLNGASMLDIMIECEQKEVVAHASVQKYLSDVWMGHYEVATWKIFLLLFLSLLPPVFFFLCLPLKWIKINHVPLVKMLLYIISHIYFIFLLALTIAFKVDSRSDEENLLMPRTSEWFIVFFICGLALSEILQPSNLNGLSSLRLVVIFLGCVAIVIHLSAFAIGDTEGQYDMIYIRNQVLGCVMLCCFVQLLDFLTFHHMFGPWAIIISDLMKDLFRFMILMGLFILGFTLQVATIRQPAYPEEFCTSIGRYPLKNPANGQNNTYITGGRVVVEDFTKMAFTLFGLVDYGEFIDESVCIPIWAETWSYYVFGLYNVIALIVLINLLIAMMSDTYQRIEQQSDIEWKFGRALLIRTMSVKTPAAPPVNLIVATVFFFYGLYKYKGKFCSVRELMRDDEVIGADGSDELGLGGPAGGAGGGGGGMHAETVTNVTEQEVLSSTSSATKQSGTVSVKTGSTRHTMGTKRKSRNGGGAGGKYSVGHESVPLRVENVVDWDVVMNMYKDMQHMDDDALEDSRHQSDHKNYDLGGSFSATKAIDNSFGFTA